MLTKSESQNENRMQNSEMANINEQSGSLFDEKHEIMALNQGAA